MAIKNAYVEHIPLATENNLTLEKTEKCHNMIKVIKNI